MLCSIDKRKHFNRRWDSEQQFLSLKNKRATNFFDFVSDGNKRNFLKQDNYRFENLVVKVVRISDKFFESFPFYERIKHNWN